MKILIIGYSSIVQRRVLPALHEIADITGIDIATRRGKSVFKNPDHLNGTIYEDYNQALTKSTAELVYISTVNSEHEMWVEKAFECGKHVVVDKPACTTLDSARKMAALATQSNRCLAESIVYPYHKQVEIAQTLIEKNGSSVEHIIAQFSFPPMDTQNFRYQRSLGGGALMDLGPYAVSPGRIFFNEEPENSFCTITSTGGPDKIETGFSVLLTYSRGKTFVGHYGFDTEYGNMLKLIGPEISIELERVFAPPPDLELIINFRENNQVTTIMVDKSSSFANFFRNVIETIKGNSYKKWLDDMLMDAGALHTLHSTAHRSTN